MMNNTLKNNYFMKKTKQCIIAAIILMCVACKTIEQYTCIIPKDEQIPSKAFIKYSLPITRINICLKMVKETTIPGLYASSAGPLLGLWNCTSDSITETRLESGVISYEKELDLNSQFFIIPKKNNSCNITSQFKLTPIGYIADFSKDAIPIEMESIKTHEKGKDILQQIPLNGNYFERIDTFYKTIFKDSAYVRVPIYRRSVVEKTLEQRAQETANLIMAIRKAHVELLADPDDLNSNAQTLAFYNTQMNQLMQDYLQLFTGYKNSQVFSIELRVIPSSSDTIIHLGKLSLFTGNSADSSVAITLTIKKLKSVSALPLLKTKYTDMLIIRNPAPCLIQLKSGDILLSEKTIYIDQAGCIDLLYKKCN